MDNVWLHRFSVLVCVLTLLLVVAGGLVTSQEAALSIPDWPLAYGRLVPPLQGNIVYPFAHRVLAVLVALLSLALALWTSRRDPRPGLHRLAWMAFAVVLLEIGIGGLTVILLAPKSASILHAAAAHLVFILTVMIAFSLSPARRRPVPMLDADRHLHGTVVTAFVLLFAQTLLGAGVRHSVLGVAPHMAGAVLALIAVMWTALRILSRYLDHIPLRRSTLWTLSLTFSQIFLGLGSYMSRIATVDAPQPMPLMVAFTVAHVAAGALTLGAAAALTLNVYRHLRRPETAVAQGGMAVA